MPTSSIRDGSTTGGRSETETVSMQHTPMNKTLSILLDSQIGRIYYFLFFIAILDLPRLLSRHFIGDLHYGGLMVAIIVIALAPFVIPTVEKSTQNKQSNIYGYIVLALTSLIIARGGTDFLTMIFFSLTLFVMIIQYIGLDFYSEKSLGRYLDFASVPLFLYAALTVYDWYFILANSRVPVFGVIYFSEGWLGYELSNLSFCLFFIAVICGFKNGTVIRYALLTIGLSYFYAAIWAGTALLITIFYLFIRKLYLHQIPGYLIAIIILLGVTSLILFVYDRNPFGLTVRLEELTNSIQSIYYKNNYYGLWEHPSSHGLFPTIIYQGGVIGITWVAAVIMYFYSMIRNVGFFFLISSILFSYFFVYQYVNVLFLVILHISLLIPSGNMHILRVPQLKNTRPSIP
jgi:hypothetical protein